MAKLTNYVKVVFATAPINYGALALNRPGSAPSRTHAACCELLTHFSYELKCLQDASCGIWNNYSFSTFFVVLALYVFPMDRNSTSSGIMRRQWRRPETVAQARTTCSRPNFAKFGEQVIDMPNN